MKWIIIIITLLKFTTSNSQTDHNQSDSKNSNPKEQKQYSERALIALLDSIGQLNPGTWEKELLLMVDSTLNNQAKLNNRLSKANFQTLKKAAFEKEIDFQFAKQIFPGIELDNSLLQHLIDGKLPIGFYSFNKKEKDFKEFAISIGNGLTWKNDVYFFNADEIISKHSVFHRYGLDVKHFKDKENRTVIYYKVNYGSGSGTWWQQFNFYAFENGQLVPALTEIQNINLQYPWGIRAYWIESEIVNEKPLQIKFTYNNQFFNANAAPTEFINDSTVITYIIDKQSRKFIPQYTGSKQNKNKLLCYFHSDTELLFVNSNYNLFKKELNSGNLVKRNAILNYLSDLKNGLKSGRNR